MINNDLLLFSIHHVLVFVRRLEFFSSIKTNTIFLLPLDRKVIQTLRAAENIKVLGYVACNPPLATQNLIEYVFSIKHNLKDLFSRKTLLLSRTLSNVSLLFC